MTESKKQCFVISPIGDAGSEIRAEADWVLYQMIKPALACPLQRYQSVSHSPAALASPWADRSVA